MFCIGKRLSFLPGAEHYNICRLNNEMRQKGTEYRNIVAIFVNIPVRCTLPTANRCLFYKYSAALPLSGNKGQYFYHN
jgi:hypothetical protein